MPEKQIVKYDVTEAAISEMSNLYLDLTVVDVEDQKGFEEVELARKTVKGKRVAVEKQRKVFKSDALEYGRMVDSKAKEIFSLLEPIETHLTKEGDKIRDEEKRIKAEAEAAEKAKILARCDSLYQIEINLDYFTVATMSDEDFNTFYATAKTNFEAEQARIGAEEKAKEEAEEAALIAREKEDERLAEVAKAQKVEADRLETVRKEQDAKTAELKAAQDKIDADKKAEFERIAHAQLKANLEAEAKAKAEKDAKDEADRAAEAEKQVKLEAERQRELLPDKEKLLMFADKIKDLTAGNLSVESEVGRKLFHNVLGELANIEALLRVQTEEL